MNTNTKQVVVKVTEDQTENSGFALRQALAWLQKCYAIGFLEMAAYDDVAAANVRRMVANGEAHIIVRVDLSHQVCSFLFCRDSAGEDASELQLFTNAFVPDAPMSNSGN